MYSCKLLCSYSLSFAKIVSLDYESYTSYIGCYRSNKHSNRETDAARLLRLQRI